MLQTFFEHLSSNSKDKTLQESHIPQVISKALASAKTRGPKAANERADGSLNEAHTRCQRWRRVRSNVCQKHCPADWTTKGNVLITTDSNPFFKELLSFLKLYPKAYRLFREVTLKCVNLKLQTINLPPLFLHPWGQLWQHCTKSLNSICSSY